MLEDIPKHEIAYEEEVEKAQSDDLSEISNDQYQVIVYENAAIDEERDEIELEEVKRSQSAVIIVERPEIVIGDVKRAQSDL